MRTMEIKNLSFAMEALSRINHYEAGEAFGRIASLLRAAIKEAEEESEKRTLAKNDAPHNYGEIHS